MDTDIASGTDARGGRWPEFERRDLLWVLAAIVGVNAFGGAPALLVGPDSAWFQSLAKPALYPPGWLFGVVWTALFTLLGVALFLVVRAGTDRSEVRLALGLFGTQFLFNIVWTPTFFGAQNLLAALGVIVVLDALVVATVWAFARVDRRTAALLLPYLAWILFATVLNYQFYAINA